MTKPRGRYSAALFQSLERLFDYGSAVGSTEGELLERFVARHDESAFEALMARHGPMVLGVCRQLLHDPNDVDDAFQATFLVLVRKAGTLRRHDLLGNWLYGVAYRVAVRARCTAVRRLARVATGLGGVETLAAAGSREGADSSLAHAIEREQTPWLHQEISHLPEKYRVPIVLCYFEGLTHDEAASRLNWSLGTVKGRLARARELLRRRLARRGLAGALSALAYPLATSESNAAVPAGLEYATLKAAQAVVSGTGASLVAASAVSLPVAALVRGVLEAMIMTQFKAIALPLVLVAGTVATGVVVAAGQLQDGISNENRAPALLAGGGTQDRVVAAEANQEAFKKESKPARGEVVRSVRHDGHLAREQDTFDKLLGEFRTGDVNRFREWSRLVLEADLLLSSGQAQRVAAASAHRDRMKKMHEMIAKFSDTDHGRTEGKAALQLADADEALKEAEQWLESESQGRAIGPLYARSMPPGAMMGGAGMGSMMGTMMRGSEMQAGMMRMMGSEMRGRMMGTSGGSAAPSAQPGAAGAGSGDAKQPATGGVAGGSGIMGASGAAGAGKPGAGAPGAMMGGYIGGMMGRMMRGGGRGKAGDAAEAGTTGGMAAMMAGPGPISPEMQERRMRPGIAGDTARMATHETNPRSKAILKKLDEPIAMSFANPTPLDDVLKYVKQATTTPTYAGLAIYVDPTGLEEAGCTDQSAVSADLEGIPLKTSLRLMLKQLGLAYCVRDGVLIISSVPGIALELEEARSEEDGKVEKGEAPVESQQAPRGKQ
jgi:RNA polymerase sigma factor (sigma-70 family)